ncbi:MAG: hypothetical protein OXC80_06305 [Gammaproteobacteria bacterium]|nr:hypothetical protein [Gammaproteobacteria bacterium]
MADFLNSFESKYLFTVRWLFALIAMLTLISLIGTVLWFIWERVSGPSQSPSAYFEVPTWGQAKNSLFPIGSLATQLGVPQTGPSSNVSRPAKIEIDSNLIEVIRVLDGMYERDSSWSMSNRLDATILSTWLSNAIDLTSEERQTFNRALLSYVKALAEDPEMDLIASHDARSDAIVEGIEFFVEQYDQSLDAAKLQANIAITTAQAELATQFLLVLGVLGAGVGGLLILAVFMVMMRVESHLATVARRQGD